MPVTTTRRSMTIMMVLALEHTRSQGVNADERRNPNTDHQSKQIIRASAHRPFGCKPRYEKPASLRLHYELGISLLFSIQTSLDLGKPVFVSVESFSGMFRSSSPLLRKSEPPVQVQDTIITAWTIRHPTRNRNDPIARAELYQLSYIPPSQLPDRLFLFLSSSADEYALQAGNTILFKSRIRTYAWLSFSCQYLAKFSHINSERADLLHNGKVGPCILLNWLRDRRSQEA
ncbi:hydrolase [Striga asiatica]|uniref:Hydrolase n=1 Tax=Striga asiatica TaxID=4170 RepID=A0A5A7Q4B9_STRAF|nr:hydrolase [Striga asiatica]